MGSYATRMGGSNTPEDSYPYDSNEVWRGFPYYMSMQEGRARIDALQASLDTLLYVDTPETDEIRLADQRVFVQTVGTYRVVRCL